MNNKMSKLKRQGAASLVEYRVEAGVVDYQFELKEEILMQKIGLDRFLSVVSWSHNHPGVVAEVIEHLEGTTYESCLNGRMIKIFQDDWRRQIQSMFYLTPYQRDVESLPVPEKVSLSTLFSSIEKKK